MGKVGAAAIGAIGAAAVVGALEALRRLKKYPTIVKKTRIANNLSECIGDTPMVYIRHVNDGSGATIAAKVEMMQPCSSVKDRIALSMIEDLEAAGKITVGKSILVEPTSGNTGIAIAAVAAMKGYKSVIIMPASMSIERCMLIKALGAELVLTDPLLGIKGALAKAEEYAAKPDHIIVGQFENPANPKAHYTRTGPEILAATGGKIDIFVSGVGTGGTISGCGKYFKEQCPGVKIIAVEPTESPVLSGGKPGPHKIMGIGAGVVPPILDTTVYDEILTVSTKEAMDMAVRLCKEEGILAGISSGAVMHIAVQVAKRPENKGKLVVVVLPSCAERYLSTPMFTDIKAECEALIKDVMATSAANAAK